MSEIRSQLRLPANLHEEIKAAATKSGRSMNAEIVWRLQDSLKLDSDLASSVESTANLRALVERFGQMASRMQQLLAAAEEAENNSGSRKR